MKPRDFQDRSNERAAEEDAPLYDKSVFLGGHEIRIVLHRGDRRISYDGEPVAVTGAPLETGCCFFEAVENGEPVKCDVTFLQSRTVAVFLGRNGQLVFSDHTSIRKWLVDRVVNHLGD